jgi:hypothetical protein
MAGYMPQIDPTMPGGVIQASYNRPSMSSGTLPGMVPGMMSVPAGQPVPMQNMPMQMQMMPSQPMPTSAMPMQPMPTAAMPTQTMQSMPGPGMPMQNMPMQHMPMQSMSMQGVTGSPMLVPSPGIQGTPSMGAPLSSPMMSGEQHLVPTPYPSPAAMGPQPTPIQGQPVQLQQPVPVTHVNPSTGYPVLSPSPMNPSMNSPMAAGSGVVTGQAMPMGQPVMVGQGVPVIQAF